MAANKVINLILVDDNETDAAIIKRACSEGIADFNVRIESDAENALEYLMNDENEKPDILVLDVNLPKINGIEMLKMVRDSKRLHTTPVFMLSGLIDEENISQAQKLFANGFLQKPSNSDGYVDMVSTIEKYWVDHIRLPNNDPINRFIRFASI